MRSDSACGEPTHVSPDNFAIGKPTVNLKAPHQNWTEVLAQIKYNSSHACPTQPPPHDINNYEFYNLDSAIFKRSRNILQIKQEKVYELLPSRDEPIKRDRI